MLQRRPALLALVLALAVFANLPANGMQPSAIQELTLYDDYGEAYQAAKSQRKMLLVYFRPDRETASTDAFQAQVLLAPAIRSKLQNFVVLTTPASVTGVVQGKTIRLLDHAAFAEMRGFPGVAIVDLTAPESRHYGHVVSVYPFKPGRWLRVEHFAEMLDLPSGSLTQRTLIFAVRIHPEGPASADGRFSSLLAVESESHSRHQAQLGVQGHHNWDHRFQRISARLGMSAQEVCAESWPGQDLVDAALECVESWRQSPGHWSALRSRAAFFGFDMKRGRNGVWYGTGIFARR